jgi:hypothetical protein
LETEGLGFDSFEMLEDKFFVDVDANEEDVGFLRLLSLVGFVGFFKANFSANLLLF